MISGTEYEYSLSSSRKVNCILEVKAAIFTKYTKEMIRKKGKNIVKNDLTKFDDI
jgi:hypothetical protein